MASLARNFRQAFYTKTARASLDGLVKIAAAYCRRASWPLSDWERQIEAKALGYHRNREPMFHGGVAGLSVGERLLPGAMTGIDPHAFNDPDWKRSHVYATPTRSKAEIYADHIGGALYRVALEGSIGLDIMDVRALSLISGSPQFKRWERLVGKRAQATLIASMPVTLTCDSAMILEVLS